MKSLLSNPVKQKIINILDKRKSCCYGDIVKELHFPKLEILKHLMELKRSGFVQISASNSNFSINKEAYLFELTNNPKINSRDSNIINTTHKKKSRLNIEEAIKIAKEKYWIG